MIITGGSDKQVGVCANVIREGDTLNCEFINSLPHPLVGVMSDSMFDIETICVQTGLVRFNVCGLIQHGKLIDFSEVLDADWIPHPVDSFYLD